jgi:hypothetical protein
VNFFIFTCFNRKFRRELARVCFQTANRRKLFLRTSSHLSMKGASSHIRLPMSHQFDVSVDNDERMLIVFDVDLFSKHLHSTSFDYPERIIGHYGTNQRSLDDLRTKSIDSDYQRPSIYQHWNTSSNNHLRSACPIQSNRSQSQDLYHAQLSSNRKNFSSSSTISSNSFHSQGQNIHYQTCRRETHRHRTIGKSTTATTITTTTTTTATASSSSSARSTANTSSGDSVVKSQRKFMKFLSDRSHKK